MKTFWSDQPLPHYYAKAVQDNGLGNLVDARANRLPSVTSILDITKSPEEKARLANWRKNKGSEANLITSTACQRGKLGHRHVERYFLGEKHPCPELISSHWNNLLPVLQNINKIKLVEGAVFHFYQGYAGRVDCVANYYDIPCVIEFKFSDRIKPIYEQTPLQLAAYCGALNRQYGEPFKIRLNHTLLIVATPDEVDVTLFEPEEVMKYWKKWQQRVAKFWEQRRISA